MVDKLPGEPSEEVLEKNEDSSLDGGVQTKQTDVTNREAMTVLVAESIKKVEEAKAKIDTADNPLLAIENVVIVAAQSGIAQADIFEQVGFTSKQAQVLESLAQGEAGLGDIIDAFEE